MPPALAALLLGFVSLLLVLAVAARRARRARGPRARAARDAVRPLYPALVEAGLDPWRLVEHPVFLQIAGELAAGRWTVADVVRAAVNLDILGGGRYALGQGPAPILERMEAEADAFVAECRRIALGAAG